MGPAQLVTTSFTYDAVGRVTNIHHRDPSTDNISNFTYTYDAAGRPTTEVRLTSEDIGAVTTTYTYDITDQLTADGTATYTYDANGNREDANYDTGPGNQLETDGTWTYEYDLEGNLAKKSLGEENKTWFYGYDQKNQLIWAERRAEDDPESTLEMRVQYKYDALSNRIAKEVDEDGDTDIDTMQRYAYDNWKTGPQTSFVGNENADVWADLDGSSSLTTRYLRGDIIDQIFARIDGDDPFWLLTDKQGSLRDVVEPDGDIKNTIRYDGFGNIIYEADDAFRGRYAFTGREFDVETNLQYNRARYYDPAIGKWISRDPLGFDAGDSNLYRYVMNKPQLISDPSGLAPFDWARARATAKKAAAELQQNVKDAYEAGFVLGRLQPNRSFQEIQKLGVHEKLATYPDDVYRAFTYGIFAGKLSTRPEELKKRQAEAAKIRQQVAVMEREQEHSLFNLIYWYSSPTREELALRDRLHALTNPLYSMDAEGRLSIQDSKAYSHSLYGRTTFNPNHRLLSSPLAEDPIFIIATLGTAWMAGGATGIFAGGVGLRQVFLTRMGLVRVGAGGAICGIGDIIDQVGRIVDGAQVSLDPYELGHAFAVGLAFGAFFQVAPGAIPAAAVYGFAGAVDAYDQGLVVTGTLRAAMSILGPVVVRRIIVRRPGNNPVDLPDPPNNPANPNGANPGNGPATANPRIRIIAAGENELAPDAITIIEPEAPNTAFLRVQAGTARVEVSFMENMSAEFVEAIIAQGRQAGATRAILNTGEVRAATLATNLNNRIATGRTFLGGTVTRTTPAGVNPPQFDITWNTD